MTAIRETLREQKAIQELSNEFSRMAVKAESPNPKSSTVQEVNRLRNRPRRKKSTSDESNE